MLLSGFLFLLPFGVTLLMGETSISGGINENAITDFPYYESVENGLGEWSEQISTNIWRRYSGNTPSGSTGPAAAIAGDYYMYTEASYPNYPNKIAVLEGPCFDLSAAIHASFSHLNLEAKRPCLPSAAASD